MAELTYEHAWELSLCLRAKADEFEERAAKLDSWQRKDAGYTEATKAWAVENQESLRERASVFRAFTRDTLTAASQMEAAEPCAS